MRMPMVKCSRCGEYFSAMRADCPYCGQRRTIGGDRPTWYPGASARRQGQAAQPGAQRQPPRQQRQAPQPQRAEPQPQSRQPQARQRGEFRQGRSGWQLFAGLLLIAAGALAVLLMVVSARSDGRGISLRHTPSPSPAYTMAPRPTPSPSPTPKCENIRLFYLTHELTKESGGFTMYPGDPPLTLSARAYPADKLQGERLTWSVSDPSKARLTPSADTLSCEIEALESAGGSITLSVTCFGFTLEMPFYIWSR